MAPAVLVDQMHTSHGTPWAPFTTSDASVSFRITNTGNVVVAPNIRLEADSPLGALDSADLGPTQELLPGNSIVVTHQWSGVPAGGPVKQRVIVNGEGYEFTSSSTFWVIPWWLIPVVMGVVVLAAWLRRRLRGAGNGDRRSHAARSRRRVSGAGGGKPATRCSRPARPPSARHMRVSGRGGTRDRTSSVERAAAASRSGELLDCDIRGSRVRRGRPDGRFAGQARRRSASGTVPVRPCGYAQSLAAEQVVASVDVDGVASVPCPVARRRRPVATSGSGKVEYVFVSGLKHANVSTISSAPASVSLNNTIVKPDAKARSAARNTEIRRRIEVPHCYFVARTGLTLRGEAGPRESWSEKRAI